MDEDQLYFSEEDGDQWVEGLDGALGVRRQGKGAIELWSEEADLFLGMVPADMSAKHINAALKLYGKGILEGIDIGLRRKAREIRAALGLAE